MIVRCARAVKGAIVNEARDAKEAAIELWEFIRHNDWKKTARVMFQRRYWGWWALLAIVVALSIVLSSFHNQIVAAIGPYKTAIENAPGAWIVPIAVLIIVSFPPLLGHEIIILACGLIWDIGTAFAIACAGTFLGELALFYAFRYFFTRKAAEIEAKTIWYSCLARIMREGGLYVSTIVRFSVVPGHLTTALQSTIGLSVWVYAFAAAVSLPKQFALVYIGHVFGQTAIPLDQWKQSHAPGESLKDYYSGKDTESKRHRISLMVFGITILASLIAGYIVWQRVRKVRPYVVADMEARRLEAGNEISDEKARTDIIVEDASTPTTRAPDMSSTLPPRILTRPAMFNLSSTDSRTALLLSPAGRSRSNTVLSAASTLTSPSLPHLPIGGSAVLEDLIQEEIVETGVNEAQSGRARSMSHQRRQST